VNGMSGLDVGVLTTLRCQERELQGHWRERLGFQLRLYLAIVKMKNDHRYV